MKRVAVVGSGGSGKTTFCRELGRRSGLPVIHLDEHYWSPGWVPTPREEWHRLQVDLLAGESWIVDGNYGGSIGVRLSRADTVIVLDLPRLTCTYWALRRSVLKRGQAVQAQGCPERINLEFLKFLAWVWNYPKNSRPRIDAAIEAHRHRLRVIELATPAAARHFLDRLPPSTEATRNPSSTAREQGPADRQPARHSDLAQPLRPQEPGRAPA